MKIPRKIVYQTLLTCQQHVVGVNVSVSTNNPSSSGKRKATQNCSGKSVKTKRGSGMGAQLFLCLDKLIDSFSTRSDCTSGFMDRKWSNIEEVIAVFHSIDKVVFWSKFYCFATKYSWLEVGEKCGQR
jgi:hypothetical protein